jgi:stage II sporulation protein D
MHRRSLLAAALIVAAVVLAPVTHAAPSPSKIYVAPSGSGALFLVSGHGWGHGVGMGQWGAEGYALQSYTYDAILAAYYPGTALSTTSVKTVRVLLADGRNRLTISSDQPITLVDGNGKTHSLPAGSSSLNATSTTYPATLAAASGSTLTYGRAYRGKFSIDLVNGKLRLIDVLPLQQYLDGVVPAEMSSTWQPDALEAQAVASRSYALASRRKGGSFDVYADGRSQAYLGVAAETPEATAAVDATKGQVLVYGTKIATTVFSSSTGGWTQSATDAWGGGGAPYLVSVKDPFDGISPWHNWGPVPVTGKTLAKALGIAGKPVDAVVARNSSKRVSSLDVTSLVNGGESESSVGGGSVAAKLVLRSTWFSVAVLSLQAPVPNVPVSSGDTVTLAGVVRGVKNVVLQERSPGGAWSQVETVTPAPGTGGQISIDVTPDATTDYRLATSADAAAYVRIHVE